MCVEELYSCIKREENSLRTGLWPLSLILDGFSDFALLCGLTAGGRSLAARDYLLCFAKNGNMYMCTWPTTLPSFSTATACRSKEFSSSIYRTTELCWSQYANSWEGGEGGLNCEVKRKLVSGFPAGA